MKLFRKINTHFDIDVVNLKAGPDGTLPDPCWFCGGAITIPDGEPGGHVAILTIDTFSDERVHGVCHTSCVERAHRSLAF
jgi:hypothetical protein